MVSLPPNTVIAPEPRLKATIFEDFTEKERNLKNVNILLKLINKTAPHRCHHNIL